MPSETVSDIGPHEDPQLGNREPEITRKRLGDIYAAGTPGGDLDVEGLEQAMDSGTLRPDVQRRA